MPSDRIYSYIKRIIVGRQLWDMDETMRKVGATLNSSMDSNMNYVFTHLRYFLFISLIAVCLS